MVKVSSTHAESTAGAISYTFPTTPGLQILSVTFDGAGTGGLAAGGSITNSSNGTAVNLVSGYVYCYGISFIGAAGTSNSNTVNIGSATATTGMSLDTCTFSAQGTGVTARIAIGVAASNNDAQYNIVNCTFSNGADKGIVLRSGKVTIDGMVLAGTAPTTVFVASTLDDALFELRASDLSNLAWTNLISVTAGVMGGYFKCIGCKLRSGFTVTTGTFTGPGSMYVEVIDCNSGDVNYYYRRESWAGTVTLQNSIYYNAGDGTNDFAFEMVSSASTSFVNPLELPPISWFNKTLSAMSTTVQVTNDGTTFTNAELWQETLAKITSGAPLATWNRDDRVANILATPANQATSVVSWTGTGGFGAEVKQQLVSGSFTPAEIGNIVVIVKLAKPSETIYVSPKLITGAKQYMSYCGTLINESAVSTNPGESNVSSGVSYTINDVGYTGTLVVGSGSSQQDTIIGNKAGLG